MKGLIRRSKPITNMLFLAMLLAATNSWAQTKVSGVVRDDETGETLIGASVVIKGTTIGATTDIDGKVEFETTEKPPFTLVISYMGYVTREIEYKKPGDPIKVNLTTNSLTLDAVEIVDSRLTEKQKESPVTVESMDLIAIKETPAASFYDGLGHLKGVDLAAASIGFKIVNTRGFNSTSPVRSLQLIDGVDNQSPGLNFAIGNFVGASELDVNKVEIIVGANSALYGPNAFNGVISMTTKSPFLHKGLSVMTKVAERNMFEAAIRYARVFKNKAGKDKFAFKVNAYFMRADDWEASNTDSTQESQVDPNNWGGYDAVNTYGDENLTDNTNNYSDLYGKRNFSGLGIYYRTGYKEKDLVDYNTINVKTSASLHYKIKDDVELLYAYNFGYGTTVYQGENRYSLKNIQFHQHRLEVRKPDKYFLRAYVTHEDAGDSYDAVVTANMLLDSAKSNNSWSQDYAYYWNNNVVKKVWNLPGYPNPQVDPTVYFLPNNGGPNMATYDLIDQVMLEHSDSMTIWHQEARNYADTVHNSSELPYLNPGEAQYDSVFKHIVNKRLADGGAKLFDRSALYHIQGQYKFTPKWLDILVGGNFRMYTPNTEGNIMSDTAGTIIRNREFGFYVGLQKKLINEKLILNFTSRLDKNDNFDYLFSPAGSAVFKIKDNNVVRLSFSSAIRNPTLLDQYFYYNVGPAILIGNLNGYKNLASVQSFYDFFYDMNGDTLRYFDVEPIRPERVKTLEVGYKGTPVNNVFIDAGYHFSWYNDFIGYRLGVDATLDTTFINNPFTGEPIDTAYQMENAQAYRIASNATGLVTTQGFSIGVNYYFKKYYAITGNYSWNTINLSESNDSIIPAFNTPEHKFNLGISGRDIPIKIGNLKTRHWGFSVNYKWIQGYLFEGSPQFTGYIPTYDMVDIQINKRVPKIHTTFKLGVSNLFGIYPLLRGDEDGPYYLEDRLTEAFDNRKMQAYGGPRVGRLLYFSILFDLDKL